MSLKFRLVLAFCGISLLSILLLSSLLGYNLHIDAVTSFEATAKEALVSKLENKRVQLKRYIDIIKSQLLLQSQSTLIQEATPAFISGFNNSFPPEKLPSEKLQDFYRNEFEKEFFNLNKKNIELNIYQQIDNTARWMQHLYIAENPNPLGSKNNMATASIDSEYNDAHTRYHPEFNRILTTWEYYDVFIVDVDTGNVIYSVYKETDYATNLISGPLKNSGLAEAFKNAKNLIEGSVYLTQFDKYGPSYHKPASFMSTPIFINSQLEAVLIYQMPISEIDNILTNGRKWKDTGYGESGETYLVGANKNLLTESRFFLEDSNAYYQLLNNLGMNSLATSIEAMGTTIGVQPVNSVSVEKALAGGSGFIKILDYRNLPVFSAYTAISPTPNVTWALLSEIDEEEALKWVAILESKQLVSTLFIVALSTLFSLAVAFYIASRVSSPISSIANRFMDISSGDGDLTQRIDSQDLSELEKVRSGFNDFLEQIASIVEQVKLSSTNLTKLAKKLEDSATHSSSSSLTQKDSTFMVSAAMEQYNQSFLEVAENTEHASEEAQAAAEEAIHSANASREASTKINLLVERLADSGEAVQQLESEVDAIKTVLLTITSIADQTNLLALNAAIEAARAGEQGRGFAVVADEVRTLAGRTQQTTVEIQKKMDELQKAAQFTATSISDSSQKANEGSQTVGAVAGRLDVLSSKVKDVRTRTDTIATATTQQLATSKEINIQLENITSISEDLSETAKEVAYAIDQINAISSGINVLMGRFKVHEKR